MKLAATIPGRVIIALLMLGGSFPASAVVLWSHYDTLQVTQNGSGTDLLGGAVKRDDSAADTLYFKFTVAPASDEATEPYYAALELFEDDAERLGVGNALDAWAYSVFFPGAQSSGVPPAGYLDLRSAHPDTNALAHQATYQCPRRGETVTIVFKIQYVPGGEDLLTVWLNPDLGPGANEITQPEALTTRFHANASFDELRLCHGGTGGGWQFNDLAIATTFSDFVDSSSDRPGSSEADLMENDGAFQFQSWLKDPGLSQLPVSAVQRAKDGYLWLAAGGQIVRFDGLKFDPLNVRTTGTNGAPQVIFCDSHNALWFANAGGLQRLQNARLTLLSTNDGLPEVRITAINEDSQGAVWIGTAAGLALWKQDHLLPLPGGEPIHQRAITALFRDRQGTMWLVVSGTDIFKYEHDQLISVAKDRPKDWPADIHALLVDQASRIWLAAGEDLVLCRDSDGWHHYRMPRRTGGSRVYAFAEEPDGTLWAGGAGGLFHFSNGKFITVPAASKLAGNFVESLCVDDAGALWVGTDEGLNRLQHKCLFILGQGEGLGFGPVQGLAQVSPGVIWAIRTGDGIYRWDGRSFSRLKADGLSAHNSQANALLLAHDGVCWVASQGGLLRYKDPVAAADEVRWFELPGQNIVALAEDSAGSLWAGTREGKLWQLREGNWMPQSSVSISNAITTILPAPDGSLWLGTEGSGLVHLTRTGVQGFDKNVGLPNDTIRALFLDAQGSLWIGTASGLSEMHNGRISNFFARDGLPDNLVAQILEDNMGRLWLGTGQGVACLRKSQLDDFVAGKIGTLHPKIFNHTDGMAAEACTGGGLKSQLGLLWFATAKGVAVIAPQNWPVKQPMPHTVIEEIQLDGVPVSVASLATAFVVPPGKHRVELTYTGFRFGAPETLRFRYQLEGWDADWIDAGTSRSVVYNFVPPGKYRFRVAACDSEGNWAPQNAELGLEFTRYFWQARWFAGFAGLLALSLVGGTVWLVERQRARARLKRIEQERVLERERTRIAQDLHDEMGAKLCRISFLSEHARRNDVAPADMHEQIKAISDDSREVLHSLDEIVWAVNPQNDTLEHAVSYLAQYIQEYFSVTGVECKLEVPAQMPWHPVSSQVRHHLFLGVREALANILKHSAATQARITISCTGAGLEIIVEDNGKGFATPAQPSADAPGFNAHDGLRNMARRFTEVGGQCAVESAVGRGTIVKFFLPLPDAPKL
ncbi:MAG TPA: two-component regulator propeller domain-containing protein [Dongiaceae bacterium]|nr:two-component regulator propeller domain-containing protein [Dongiaceae bacterium]